MKRRISGAAIIALLSGVGIAVQAKIVSDFERLATLSKAQVRFDVAVEKADLLNGPAGEGAYAFNETVPCKYEEKDPKKPLGGHTPKFPCWDAKGERLKVKYNHTEIHSEVAGSRLFGALGFPTERMYSVKILCDNCPVDPWTDDGKQKRAKRLFDRATIQRRIPGEYISALEGQGWAFHELTRIDPKRGGASQADVDALRLLSVFVNHVDNTPNQQALLCPKGDDKCEKPLAYVTDLGGTFGGHDGIASFRGWSKKSAIWKDAKNCIADFKGMNSGYENPQISEAGRKLLSDLLGRLSKEQIADLFKGARFDVLSATDYPIVGPDGKSHKVKIEDWVKVFLDKRRQIADARCPK